MARRLSIRQCLALYALLTSAGMLCLALVFMSSQRQEETVERRIFENEFAPAAVLHDLAHSLASIHLRIHGALLGDSAAGAAVTLLVREREQLGDDWKSYRHDHLDRSFDPRVAELTKQIDAGLPTLWRFIDRVDAAYRSDDAAALAKLRKIDWFAMQHELLDPLDELRALQGRHLEQARRELEQLRQRSRLLTGALLAIGVLILSGFAIGLSRHITRRIVEIERALEGVATGQADGITTYPADEIEMSRITHAINRTVAELASNHNAITRLMRTQQTILESAAEGIYGVDAEGRLMFINPAALAMLGYREEEVLGQPSHSLFHHHYADGRPYPLAECPIAESRRIGRADTRVDEVFFRKDGSELPVEYTSAPLREIDDSPSGGGVVVFHDVTSRREQEQLLQQTVMQLRSTNARLQETQSQLLQAEKLAGVGQLAAGVAHEINNPIGFIRSNIGTLENYLRTLFELITGYESLIAGLNAGDRAEASRMRERAELDFLRDDLDTLIAETRDGLRRVSHIVSDLKDFSQLDGSEGWEDADLLRGLESTLHVVGATIAEKARIVRDYAPLPAVRCHAGQINQVFMNLLLNAAHAIEEFGTITVHTRRHGDEVCIEIRDTGRGMDARERERMFDPFFTTKPVGKGTGLGLSVSYGIVQRHGGHFEVDSEPGRGTRVALWLPVNRNPDGQSAQR